MNYKKNRILLVDDELGWCQIIKSVLQEHGFEVEYEIKAENALKKIISFNPNAVLLDILFDNVKRGKATFRNIKKEHPQLNVIMLTNTVIENDFRLEDYSGCAFTYAKDQLKIGTDDVYKEFAKKIRRAIEKNYETADSLQREFDFIVGKTEALKGVCKDIFKVAITNATVLITGESGVGKGLVAGAIKDKSKRSNKRCLTKSCTDFSNKNMLLSELFGHEKGAFTGAEARHKGIFEEAAGGTVFIDEIGDASLEAQGRFLRVLQEKTVRRMKGNKDIKVDTRVIMATNRNLESMVKEGKFRGDLYYRLNQFKIYVPPLGERIEDIPELLAYFIRKYNEEDDKNILIETKKGEKDYLRPDVLDLLREHAWPGNIRELENMVRRAMINAGDTNILLICHFDFGIKIKKHKPVADVGKLINDIFEKKWYGKDKWNTFIKIYTATGLQKEILQECITRLKEEKQKGAIGYRDLANLFGITENNMRQRIHLLGINWSKIKKP